MDQQTIIIIIAIAAVIALAAIVALVVWMRNSKEQRRRREELQERYGPEYARTVEATGSEKKAVAELTEREQRHERLQLHTLSEDDTAVVRTHLAQLQYRFVEDPGDALLGLGRVVIEVLRVRGYPVSDDREEGLRLLALDHPEEAQSVRRLLHGEADADATSARHTFLEARNALRSVAGITYELADGAPDARVEDLGDDRRQPVTSEGATVEAAGSSDEPDLYGPDGSPITTRS
jgi:hypothetical protein